MPRLLQRLHGYAKYGFPVPLLPARTTIERLRTKSFSDRVRHQRTGTHLLLTSFAWFAYPVAAIPSAWQNFRELKKLNKTAGLKQFFGILQLALLRNVPPVEYLFYRFDDPQTRSQHSQYLYWMDSAAILWLNRCRGAKNAHVQDKALFASICAKSGLPHVATLAVFRNGEQVEGGPLSSIALPRVWVKPIDLSGSRGMQAWQRDAAGAYRCDSFVLTPQEWEKHLRLQNCLVQPHVVNHSGLRSLTNGAAAVLRLITVLSRSGQASLIGASVSLPFGEHITTQGAILCTISLEEGRIFKVFHHIIDVSGGYPGTGEVLLGRVLPLWKESAALVLRAHRMAFSRFASLGWDVVITEEGPLLLEANSAWGSVSQQVDFGPLGHSAFLPVVEEELRLAS